MRGILKRLVGVVSAVVLYAAGAMSMEVESPAGIHGAVHSVLQKLADNPVRYWVINGCDEFVKIDAYLHPTYADSKLYRLKIITPNSISYMTEKNILEVKEAVKKCIQASEYGDLEINFFIKNYSGFVNLELAQNYANDCIPMTCIEGSEILGKTVGSRRAGEVMLYRRPMCSRLLPFGSCFVIEPNFSNVRHLSFNDCFSEFYEKIKYVLTNDDSCPFALLPLELRWKIGFHILGVWAPFERL